MMSTPEAIFACWLLFLGAAVGSFLNVVIYRVPAGMSIVQPGSHCPVCKHPIRWFDNIPVLSWVVLRARCRDCRSSISLRYPLVEAGTAALFMVLALPEIFGGAANVPLRPLELNSGMLFASRTAQQLLGIFAYHALLLCMLLAAAAVAFDGKRPSLGLFLPALAAGAIAPLVWPELRPVAAWRGMPQGWPAGLIDGAAGAAAGLIVGQVFNLPRYVGQVLGLPGRVGQVSDPPGKPPAQPACSANDALPLPSATEGKLKTCPTAACPMAAACVGLFLGWQAIVPLVILTLLLYHALNLAGRLLPGLARLPAIAWLGLVALAWILNWGRLVAWWSGT